MNVPSPVNTALTQWQVVGAGTAGGAVAARLALAGYSVGLVEAGSFYDLDNGNKTTVPGYDQTTHPNDPLDSLVDYDFVTEPEPVGHPNALRP